MSFEDFHYYTTMSRLIYASFIHYNTICEHLFISYHFEAFKPYHINLVKRICHQEDSPAKYFILIYSHFKNLKV